MNYEILRHINNLYDNIEILNSQLDTLNRQYLRLSRQNNQRELFRYDNPVFIPPMRGLRNRVPYYYVPPSLDEIRVELNNRINRRNMNTTNNVTNTNINSNTTPLNTNTNNTTLNSSLNENNTPLNSTLNSSLNENNTNNTQLNQNETNTQLNQNETNTPFNENFATSFAQRIHNILTAVNNDEFPTNIQIETHTQVIISHKSVSNNTSIEHFNNTEEVESTENDSLNRSTESTTSNNLTESGNEYRCLICMENIQNNSIVRRLNKCNHVFHVDCIDKWFERKITCPTCRQDIRDLPAVNNENENENNLNDV